ncbi:holin-like protein [Bisgaardia hudsonensis]|uniref:Holin-like protein n=1 Tax=Bisgaardia hudsonensis TaxID=109472 RepID=A0A4R2MVY3_9PAST|nr:CidA/LrgA family protein [Bisgaardia hudsonensis]QLB13922.1 hypothetical protein A6A11_06550 [Bisgaardia hudsonensis]TCP10962.1 holin-like protein [Bisgaardia hudsonensis]
MKLFIDVIRSFSILYVALFLGSFVGDFIPVNIPSSIWGLLLLFIGLVLKLIKVEWIKFGANLLIRYMAILFIPISVGIIKYYSLLINNATALLIPNIISTLLSLVFAGYLSHYLFSRKSFSQIRKKLIKKRTLGK